MRENNHIPDASTTMLFVFNNIGVLPGKLCTVSVRWICGSHVRRLQTWEAHKWIEPIGFFDDSEGYWQPSAKLLTDPKGLSWSVSTLRVQTCRQVNWFVEIEWSYNRSVLERTVESVSALNDDQRQVYEQVTHTVNNDNLWSKLCFLERPGGTEK
jgi:hypothetical protein